MTPKREGGLPLVSCLDFSDWVDVLFIYGIFFINRFAGYSSLQKCHAEKGKRALFLNTNVFL